VAANGLLVSDDDTGHGMRSWTYEARDPMASYLVTADIGHWLVKQGRTPGGIPEYVAVDPVLPDVTTTRNGRSVRSGRSVGGSCSGSPRPTCSGGWSSRTWAAPSRR